MVITSNYTNRREFSIVAVDDDPDFLDSLVQDIRGDGFKLSVAHDGEAGLKLIKNMKPDLVILDVNMPCLNGLEVCKLLRNDKNYSDLPIILLSGRNMEMDRIGGLETGADDYVSKPYNSRELVLRIKRILWRAYGRKCNEEVLSLGELQINFENHQVWVDDYPVTLTRTEFRLLSELLDNPGRVKSRDSLLNKVWDHTEDIFSRTLDTHIQRLRNKLKQAGRYIETVRGIGYRFRIEDH